MRTARNGKPGTDTVLLLVGTPHVNIFVGNESIRHTGGLGTQVESGITTTIIPAVSGG